MVTIAILKENGYEVGVQKNEKTIELAERDVKAAYFLSNEDFSSDEAKQLLYALTFSLLLKRKTVLTRFGSDVKTSQYTIAAENEQIRSEIIGYCDQKLNNYLSDKNYEPNDILGIYDKLFFI